MAFIPVTDAAEVDVNFHIGSIAMQNTFGYQISGALTQATTDLAGEAIADAYNHLTGFLGTGVVFDSVVLTDLNSVGAPQYVSAAALPDTGTDANGLLPYQTAALVSWSTAGRGRSYRGRSYLAGFCEDFSTGRDVAAGLITALGLWAGELLNDGNFGVISRFELNPTPPPATIPRAPGFITQLTNYTVHPLWRTQRRRATR